MFAQRHGIHRPQAVSQQRFRPGGDGRFLIAIDFIFCQRRGLQVGNGFLQNRFVPGHLHVFRCQPGQKQPVVADAGAHAAPGRMPPVLHVACRVLMGGAQKNVFPHELRLCIQQRQTVLQLVTEADGPARLVRPDAPHQPGSPHLIRQPAVHHAAQRFVEGEQQQTAQPVAPEPAHCPGRVGSAFRKQRGKVGFRVFNTGRYTQAQGHPLGFPGRKNNVRAEQGHAAHTLGI